MKYPIAMLAIAAISLWACSKEAGKAATPKTPMIPINLACVMNPDFAIVHLALAQGYFSDLGLEVKVKRFEIGKTALSAVIRGEADLATALETPMIFSILGGERLGIVASIGSSNRNQSIVASREAGVTRPGDLKGKPIGVTKGTAAEYFLNSFLIANGIEQKEELTINLQPGELLPALQTGKVAAAEMWNPLIAQAVAALEGRAIVFYGENIYTAYNCIAGQQAFLGRNPKSMKAFIQALLRAEEFLVRNPAESLALLAKYTATDEAVLRPILDLYRFEVTLDQSLILVLEDETRWAMKMRPSEFKIVPNYLDFLYTEALSSAAPDRVRLIR